MRNNRVARRLVGVAAAAMISVGVAAPAGFAQYGEELPTTSMLPAPGSPAANRAALKKCIAKAQTKFGDNRVKKKAAIRKCRKKFR